MVVLVEVVCVGATGVVVLVEVVFVGEVVWLCYSNMYVTVMVWPGADAFLMRRRYEDRVVKSCCSVY